MLKFLRSHSVRGVPYVLPVILLLFLLGTTALIIYLVHLDSTVQTEFEGKKWELPSRVYARPLDLYAGKPLTRARLEKELVWLHYQRAVGATLVGSFSPVAEGFLINVRQFKFWDTLEPERLVRVHFSGDSISEVRDEKSKEVIAAPIRLDPIFIGAIYSGNKEDRVLVQLKSAPAMLAKTLIAVEDRDFYDHIGLSPKGMLRAAISNLMAMEWVQGGSTITQQLVKNMFLTSERTLTRKVNELFMAILLERRYSKEEILETYFNEIYLGQDGARGIHGFGLASHFYFGRPLGELSVPEISLLIGMVKGPSFYDPRRSPKRALDRRDQVLATLVEQSVISKADGELFKKTSLGVTKVRASGLTPYPAFLDLVKRQLKETYREEDLSTTGMQLFTTLDVSAQVAAEKAIMTRIGVIEQRQKKNVGKLQAAVVLSDASSGEVLALVGDRNPRFLGFNRALDAARPIGSLAKPAVYLTALSRPDRYGLATLLDDSDLSLGQSDGKNWEPQNYDGESHGEVTLTDSLAHSYNIATVRLGLALGVPKVVATMHKLGLRKTPPPLPSLLLGAFELTPFETAQMYQTIASGGFRVPMRALLAVTRVDGTPLQRFTLKVEQAISPQSNFLISTAMRRVVESGTARDLARIMPRDLRAAGKTGTTDDLRDSWFAGFTGDHLAVVWVGRDDNLPTQLTGATGAMTIWGALFSQLDSRPLDLDPPNGVTFARIDMANGRLAQEDCATAEDVPVIVGYAPTELSDCGMRGSSPVDKAATWFKGWFE